MQQSPVDPSSRRIITYNQQSVSIFVLSVYICCNIVHFITLNNSRNTNVKTHLAVILLCTSYACTDTTLYRLDWCTSQGGWRGGLQPAAAFRNPKHLSSLTNTLSATEATGFKNPKVWQSFCRNGSDLKDVVFLSPSVALSCSLFLSNAHTLALFFCMSVSSYDPNLQSFFLSHFHLRSTPYSPLSLVLLPLSE